LYSGGEIGPIVWYVHRRGHLVREAIMPNITAISVASAHATQSYAAAQTTRPKVETGPPPQQAKPVETEIRPTQPVAMPPVVTALTADFDAGRAAAEAARAAYRAQIRISQL
jgi:hypothetical protein